MIRSSELNLIEARNGGVRSTVFNRVRFRLFLPRIYS